MTYSLYSQPAAIAGTFTEYRMVKTRSAFQLIIEIPIERQREAFLALGYPVPGTDIHVAVARLVPQTVAQDSEQGRGTPTLNQNNISASGDDLLKRPAVNDVPSIQPPDGGASVHKERRPWETLSPQQQAGILCADKGFQKWVSKQAGWECDEEDAASWLRIALGIESRRELADKPELVREFNRIRERFLYESGRVPEALR